jgi:hypothetical protein
MHIFATASNLSQASEARSVRPPVVRSSRRHVQPRDQRLDQKSYLRRAANSFYLLLFGSNEAVFIRQYY